MIKSAINQSTISMALLTQGPLLMYQFPEAMGFNSRDLDRKVRSKIECKVDVLVEAGHISCHDNGYYALTPEAVSAMAFQCLAGAAGKITTQLATLIQQGEKSA